MADVALAGRVIASHYAEPVERRFSTSATLRSAPMVTSETVVELEPGAVFLMVDETLGWAWGYAGGERRVGYVPSDALCAQ